MSTGDDVDFQGNLQQVWHTNHWPVCIKVELQSVTLLLGSRTQAQCILTVSCMIGDKENCAMLFHLSVSSI